MELLSVHSPPARYRHEADRLDITLPRQQQNKHLLFSSGAMADGRKISSIHDLINEDASTPSRHPARSPPASPESIAADPRSLPGIDSAMATLRMHHHDSPEAQASRNRSQSTAQSYTPLPSFSELDRRTQQFQSTASSTAQTRPHMSMESLAERPRGMNPTPQRQEDPRRPAQASSYLPPSDLQLHNRGPASGSTYAHSATSEQHHAGIASPPLSLASQEQGSRQYSRNDAMQPGSSPRFHPPHPNGPSPQGHPSPAISITGSAYPPTSPSSGYYHYVGPLTQGFVAKNTPPSIEGALGGGSQAASMSIPSTPSTSSSGVYKKRRGNLPREGVRVMRKWLDENKDNPYPDEQQKQWFMKETNLAMAQINNWFINARRRLFSPQERERVRKNRAEASGSQSSGSRPNSAHSNRSAPDQGGFDAGSERKASGKKREE